MRSLKLTLSPAQPLRLPFAHFEILQGVFYKLLSRDAALAAAVHDKQPGPEKQFKFFCFTDLHGRYAIENRTLVYTGEVRWELRSADEAIIRTVAEAVTAVPHIEIYGTPCTVLSCDSRETRFLHDVIDWEMDTPLLYYRTDDRGFSTYYAPAESCFTAGIAGNVVRKYTAFYGEPPRGVVRFEVLGGVRKCVTRYKHSAITGYYGRYRLRAPATVLDFVYHTGLGAKNSMGFGVVK